MVVETRDLKRRVLMQYFPREFVPHTTVYGNAQLSAQTHVRKQQMISQLLPVRRPLISHCRADISSYLPAAGFAASRC